jgi:hypothetical protein
MNVKKFFVFRMQGPAWWVWWCFGRLADGAPNATIGALSEIERRVTTIRKASNGNQKRHTFGFQLPLDEVFAGTRR